MQDEKYIFSVDSKVYMNYFIKIHFFTILIFILYMCIYCVKTSSYHTA